MTLRKLLLFLLLASACTGAAAQNCCTAGHHCAGRDTAKVDNVSPSTLIVYYSGKKRSILRLVRKIGAEVIYDYNNFNAVAIRKPDAMTLDETKSLFEKQKGVLQVVYDHVYHLD